MQEFPLKYVYKQWTKNMILVYNRDTELLVFRLEIYDVTELPEKTIQQMIRGMLSAITGYAPISERFDIQRWKNRDE